MHEMDPKWRLSTGESGYFIRDGHFNADDYDVQEEDDLPPSEMADMI